jgi:hypothetical protein
MNWPNIGAALICTLTLASCRPPASSGPLHLETASAGADTRFTLVADSGVKLNARLKPALELEDGRVIRFDSPRLTKDSAYFAEPPTAIASGRRARWHGTLRASVCDAGENVCRSIALVL